MRAIPLDDITAIRPIRPYDEPEWRIEPIGDWLSGQEFEDQDLDRPEINLAVNTGDLAGWDADLVIRLTDTETGWTGDFLARIKSAEESINEMMRRYKP